MIKTLKNLVTMQSKIPAPSKVKYDSTRKMMALQYNGKRTVKVGECPVPIVTDPTDAIIKITAATICGSDLHFYNREVPGMNKGYIMGHEGIGIVDEVGPEVKHIKKGERVVISAVLGCGQCEFCQRQQWSLCDTTNQNPVLDEVYGDHIGGFIGYSHTFGGYDGVHAEYVRVPFADFNLFPIPSNVSDRQALPVADALSTSYHGTELADIQKGDEVAIFGCGPVGLLTMMWAKYRGASKIIAIDVDAERLEFAKKNFGVDIVNSSEEDPSEAVFKIIPGGPEKIIECAGFRFPEKLLDKIQFKLKLESDAPNIINHAIKMVKKGGRITIIGDYGGYANHLWIGGIMMKHLTVNGGCVWPQKYQKMILELLASGKIDPTVVLTHTFPLSKGDEAYKMFNDHDDGCIKTFIVPDSVYNEKEKSK